MFYRVMLFNNIVSDIQFFKIKSLKNISNYYFRMFSIFIKYFIFEFFINKNIYVIKSQSLLFF